MNRGLVQQFARFCAVGAVGFLIDGGILWILLSQAVDAFAARAVSFPLAVLATWGLNRRWTFNAKAQANRLFELNAYLVVQLAGLLLNLGCFSLAIWLYGREPWVVLSGFALGSAIAMFWNFFGARFILQQRDDPED